LFDIELQAEHPLGVLFPCYIDFRSLRIHSHQVGIEARAPLE